jgi:hypothetical protein
MVSYHMHIYNQGMTIHAPIPLISYLLLLRDRAIRSWQSCLQDECYSRALCALDLTWPFWWHLILFYFELDKAEKWLCILGVWWRCRLVVCRSKAGVNRWRLEFTRGSFVGSSFSIPTRR